MKIVADQNIPFVKECFGSLGDVQTYPGRQLSPAHLADADILLVRSVTAVNEALLAKSAVKFVATATIGFEHIDRDYLRQRGIGFASAPGSNANSVAEYIVAALLSIANKHKFSLAGKSIGIVGVGNVGSRVAKKCAALGIKVVLNDPPLQRATQNPIYRPLAELMDCDFITLHTPLTKTGQDKTYHLADKAFFDSLKTGAFFLNSSRGAVHCTDALKNALKTKKLAGAVLDVWENEPNIDPELLRIVDISTPHIAGYSFDGKVAGLMMIYQAACDYFGLPSRHKISDFLPPPPTPLIRVDDGLLQNGPQAALHQIVQQIYPINRDDFNTREILMVPPEQRGAFFDKLRKEYPIRREFQNTVVELPKNQDSLAKMLEGIGFQIR